jgi:hypothetical protein
MSSEENKAQVDELQDRNRSEFTGPHPDLTLRLRFSANTARQRDADRFWQAYRAETGGQTAQEDAGKTLRSAIKAGWVAEPSIAIADVDDLPPWKVRWMSSVIDSVYSMMVSVPKA